MSARPRRLAIVTSHAIQYQAPLFRALQADGRLEPHVFLLSRHGLDERLDSDLDTAFAWDVDLLSGYRSEYVPNLVERRPVGGVASYLNPSLVPRLRRARPDALLLFGLRNLSSLAAYLYAGTVGLPRLYRAESSALEPRPARSDRIMRRLLRGVDAVVPIGTANDRYYEQLGYPAERRFPGPYTVDSEHFDSLRLPRREAREALGIPPGDYVVMIAGKLIERKDPISVVHACALVDLDRPVRLLVVGNGPLRGEITQAAAALGVELDLRGFLNQSELGVAYSAADVFVLASRSEPWGLVVNEAMHFSLPVIVSSMVGCGPDLVRDGENGAIFAAGSVERLAAALEPLGASPDLAARQGALSRRIIDAWGVDATVDGVVQATYAVLQ